MITKKRTHISSLNFPYIGIMGLWLYLYKSVFMTSLMTSPGHKVGKKINIAISPSTFQPERRSKAQNITNTRGYHAGIFNFRYSFQSKNCRDLKMAAIWKFLKYWTQLQFHLRYKKIEIMPRKLIFKFSRPQVKGQRHRLTWSPSLTFKRP